MSAVFSRVTDFLAREWPAISCSVGLLLAGALLWRRPKHNLPIVKPIPGRMGHSDAIHEGYLKYPDTPFVLQSSPPFVFLPAKCVNEVKSLPESQASITAEIHRNFCSNVTGIGVGLEGVVPPIKNDLTKHIGHVVGGLQDELRYGLDKEFGSCEKWTGHNVFHKMTRVIALLNGLVFVGQPLSRNEEWLDATINYTSACVKATVMVSLIPWPFRRILGPYIPAVVELKKHRRRGAEMLKPLQDEILKREHEGLEPGSDDNFNEGEGTLCSWLLKYVDEKHRNDPLCLSYYQLGLSFAAIHTTSMAVTHAINDLVSMPEYIKELTGEVQQAMIQDGLRPNSAGIGNFQKSSYAKMHKLDSFIKESQRFSPPQITSMARLTMAPLTLSTGHTIPKGMRIGVPVQSIHFDASTETFSPAYNGADYVDPAKFDGLRFYKLRSTPGKGHKHQYVTAGPDSLSLGCGPYACPGRFFAGYEIKIVLVELLLRWDMRMQGDEEGKGGGEASEYGV